MRGHTDTPWRRGGAPAEKGLRVWVRHGLLRLQGEEGHVAHAPGSVAGWEAEARAMARRWLVDEPAEALQRLDGIESLSYRDFLFGLVRYVEGECGDSPFAPQ